MEKIIKLICGVGLLISFVFYKVVYKPKKDQEKKEKILSENPEMEYKLRIINSREEKLFGANIVKNVSLFLFSIICMILIPFAFVGIGNMFEDQNIFINILLIIAIMLVLYREYIRHSKINKHKTMFQNLIYKKYGKYTIEPKPKNKIASGNLFEIGSIKHDYISTYKILKFNCIITNYFKKEFVSTRDEKGRTRKEYKKIGNFVEYAYDLKQLGINNLSGFELENIKIKKNIIELSDTKIINVELKENWLLIEKEIVLYGYTREDVINEVEDVKIFYDKIILPLIDILNQNK